MALDAPLPDPGEGLITICATLSHLQKMEEDETMLPVREGVWLEGKAYSLAWIGQTGYPGILMPVEPVYISRPKGQLSTF